MTSGAPALGLSCPACAAPLVVDDGRCAGCGSPALEPHRRVVTLLFADLAGYTELCASLDPEDVHLLVRPLMNGLRRIVEDLGGVVPAIEGDGFMAVFGARRTSEDDPLRAATAAVRLQEAMEERRAAYGEGLPGLRVGLNLGEVLVAPSWEQSGFSLSGDPVNVASRLCGLAEPGEVVAADDVVAVLPTSLTWSPAEALVLRNRRRPVMARRLAWRAAPAGPVGRAPSATPLVGRGRELAALEGALAALVVGEAGIGKSRLVAEWGARSGRRVVSAACPSFAARGPQQVLADLVGPLSEAAPAVLGLTGARRVQRLLGGAVDSTEGDSVDDQLGAAVELLKAVSGLEPLAVVVEDVHWASAEVRAVLASLAEGATDRLRVVLTGREDLDDVPSATRVAVGALDDGAADQLVELLLPGADSDLKDVLRVRAGGVPLYLEQCARLLVEDGTVEVGREGARLVDAEGLRRVPTSMRLFVAARIDLLGDDERAVLGAAAVAGDTVHPDLLRHLCRGDVGELVEALLGRGLLAWRATDDGPQLGWRHAVVRDVVYDSMLLRRRVETHRNAAEWFSVRLPRDALVGRAAHLEAAVGLVEGRGATDCGMVADAVRALALLGHGILTEDPTGAVAAVERGIRLVERHPECGLDRLDLDLLHAEGCEGLGRHVDAESSARRALTAAEAVADDLGTARASLALGRVLWADAPADAQAALDRAAMLFDRLGDQVGLSSVEVERAHVGHFDGLGAFLAAHERAFHASERAGDFRWSNYMAQTVAVHAFIEGRPLVRQWTDLALAGMRFSDTAGRGRLVLAEAGLELHAHDLDRSVELSLQARDLGLEAGVRHTVLNAAVFGAEAAAVAGRLGDAEQLVGECHRLLDQRRTAMLATNTLVVEGYLRSRQGRHEEAERLLAEADAAVAELGDVGGGLSFQRELLCARARRRLDTGDAVGARELAAQALDVCRGIGEPFVELRVRLLHMAASVSARQHTLESTRLRRDARERGAPVIDGLAARWLELDDLLRGDLPLVAVELPPAPPGAEGRALDCEVRAFLEGDYDLLLEAAEAWRGLGVTHFPARSLLWHAALTGDESHADEAREVLAAAGAPDGLEQVLRAQPRPPSR